MAKIKYQRPTINLLNKYTHSKYVKLLSLRPSIADKLPYKKTISNKYNFIDYIKPDETTGNIYKAELIDERYRFEATEDPYSAISIFTECYEKGYYPPDDVITFFYNKFKDYMKSDKTLDETLKVGKSAKNNYKRFKRNRDIIIDIDTLQYRFGITKEDAIDAVTRKYEILDIGSAIGSIEKVYSKDIKIQREESLMYLHSELFNDYYYEGEDDGGAELELNTSTMSYLEDILLQYPVDIIEYLEKKYPNIKTLLKSLKNMPVVKLSSDESV